MVNHGKLFDLVAVKLGEPGAEALPVLLAIQVDAPVLACDKCADLDFALADQPERGALHAAGRQPAADFLPQQGGQVETDQIVQRASRLLRIDQRLQDFARIGDRSAHGALRDFVEDHALHGLVLQQTLLLENLRKVPGNRLTFTVRVSCEEDMVSGLDRLCDRIDVLLVALDQLVLHGKVVFGVDRTGLRHQIAHVPVGRKNLKGRPEILLQGFRLRGRFDDQQVFSHARTLSAGQGSMD